MDVARDIFNNHLIDLQAMLGTQVPPGDHVDGRTVRPSRRKEVGGR